MRFGQDLDDLCPSCGTGTLQLAPALFHSRTLNAADLRCDYCGAEWLLMVTLLRRMDGSVVDHLAHQVEDDDLEVLHVDPAVIAALNDRPDPTEADVERVACPSGCGLDFAGQRGAKAHDRMVHQVQTCVCGKVTTVGGMNNHRRACPGPPADPPPARPFDRVVLNTTAGKQGDLLTHPLTKDEAAEGVTLEDPFADCEPPPVPPEGLAPNREPCEYCGRKMVPTALARHVEYCPKR